MRNSEILNSSSLDESFSNFSSGDVLSIRSRIQELEARLSSMDASPAMAKIALRFKTEYTAITMELAGLKAQYASIPKAIIDAADRVQQASVQLSQAEKDKLEAAELLSANNQIKATQSLIDKQNATTEYLKNEINGTGKKEDATSSPKTVSKISGNLMGIKPIYVYSGIALVVLVGGYFAIKAFKK